MGQSKTWDEALLEKNHSTHAYHIFWPSLQSSCDSVLNLKNSLEVKTEVCCQFCSFFHLICFEKGKQINQTPTTLTPPQISSANNSYLQSNTKYCNIPFQQWKTAKLWKVKYLKPRKGQYKNLHYNKGPSISQPRYAEVQLLYIRFYSQLKPT